MNTITNERIYIFIDFGNIHREFLKLNFKADYVKVKSILSENKDLIKIILYMSVIHPIRPSIKGWLSRLERKHGIEVKYIYLKVLPSGKKIEKGVDVLLAVDMLYCAFKDKYDTAILVSGDADFIPVIKKLLDLGKKVEIWGFKNSIALKLIDIVGNNNVNYIDEILGDIEKI